jgi:hypothetical protein
MMFLLVTLFEQSCMIYAYSLDDPIGHWYDSIPCKKQDHLDHLVAPRNVPNYSSNHGVLPELSDGWQWWHHPTTHLVKLCWDLLGTTWWTTLQCIILSLASEDYYYRFLGSHWKLQPL